jgi:hypothetical protein
MGRDSSLWGRASRLDSVAVLEMHVQSFHKSAALSALTNEQDEPRQLEGPVDEEAQAA